LDERTRSLRERLVRITAAGHTDVDLAEAALVVAAEEYEGLDVSAYLERLDALAARAAQRLTGCSSIVESATAINRFLFAEEGFAGNRDDYYDPRNSYLNDVLDRRSGIPITLSLVYLAVARRLGCDVRGVGFPGHFLVKWVGANQLIVDPFAAAVLSRADCQDRLAAALGEGVDLDPTIHLRSAAPLEILVRLLGNLKQIHSAARDWPRALACCDRILLLAPHAPLELRDRAAVHERLGWSAAALADLEALLELVPDGEAASALRSRCEALRAGLH
jgi:regulator of sirC expression with transglutaminase-like and TPR domain